MLPRASYSIGLFLFVVFMALCSPYDLVNAVNALRASFGLAPYRVNSILMSTAQAQAEFLFGNDNGDGAKDDVYVDSTNGFFIGIKE